MKRLLIGGPLNGQIHEAARDHAILQTAHVIDDNNPTRDRLVPEGMRDILHAKIVNVFYRAMDLWDPGDDQLGRPPSMTYFFVEETEVARWSMRVKRLGDSKPGLELREVVGS